MTSKRPPAFAAWLYKTFACGPNIDAALGDLAEQYSRRSSVWYWRQVLKGIPVSVVTEARGHKMIAARAIVTGCIAWFVFLVLYPGLVFGFASQSGPPSTSFPTSLIPCSRGPLCGFRWRSRCYPRATRLPL